MKTISLLIVGLGAVALILGLNLRHAFNYGIIKNNLAYQIVAQTNSSGGDTSGGGNTSGGGDTSGGGNTGGNTGGETGGGTDDDLNIFGYSFGTKKTTTETCKKTFTKTRKVGIPPLVYEITETYTLDGVKVICVSGGILPCKPDCNVNTDPNAN